MTRQELHCHGCDRYVQFDMDLSLNGNHVFNCPNCGHEHCRVVENGKITGDRWDVRHGGMATIWISTTTATTSATSTWDTYTGGSGGTATTDTFTYYAWANTTTGY